MRLVKEILGCLLAGALIAGFLLYGILETPTCYQHATEDCR